MHSKYTDKVIASPNFGTRNAQIDTITIHHMAGNLSIETCGRLFQNKKRNASSNYGIGTDGRIACYVEEENRAKTSSNWRNDARAITIEIANDTLQPDWHISDFAMNSCIKLVADVCTRHGIKKLVWSDDKSTRVAHKDGCNMTVHKDFSATLCPGPYLYSKMSYIANEVNKIINKVEEPKDVPNTEFKPFLIRVTASVLNIRTSAGTAYKIKGTVMKGEVFTIVEVRKVGTIQWGKLKSGAGWICLAYTEPVHIN